ncbi:MAG: UDP-N-acetylmuramate dehydrogenase [Alphaproteobacteria bacterium]|nr:UDP-N-acetylmuramate dehydrogenase [Alphaproteobacteria bacterium]
MFATNNTSDWIDMLPKIRGKYLRDVNLSKHTWLGVGGPAEIMFIPQDVDDLCYFLRNKPYNVPVCLIGGGSNLLIRDGGILGVVVKLDSPFFRRLELHSETITCYAGLKNIELKKVLLENQLGGLEFLCSIPGCIGGSIKTNTGCFGKCIKDVLVSATIVNSLGQVKEIMPEDLQLSYRSSLFPDDWIIVSITLKTQYSPTEEIAKILDEHKQYRVNNQPYNQKTAGSTFKNPQGLKAWELIKKSGCADLKIGGAKVSEKHCNFLINTGTATAKDVEELGETIIKKVKEETSITLEWEIKRMGISDR